MLDHTLQELEARLKSVGAAHVVLKADHHTEVIEAVIFLPAVNPEARYRILNEIIAFEVEKGEVGIQPDILTYDRETVEEYSEALAQ